MDSDDPDGRGAVDEGYSVAIGGQWVEETRCGEGGNGLRDADADFSFHIDRLLFRINGAKA